MADFKAQVDSILGPIQADPTQKNAAVKAFFTANDNDSFVSALQGIDIPPEAKASLYKAKAPYFGKNLEAEILKTSPPPIGKPNLPTPQSVPMSDSDKLGSMVSPVAQAAYSGLKSGAVDAARYASGINNIPLSPSWMANKAIKAVIGREPLAEASQTTKQLRASVDKDSENDDQGFIASLAKGIGRAPGDIVRYGSVASLPIPLAAKMALVEGITNSDDGIGAAVTAALKGGTSGALMHGVGSLTSGMADKVLAAAVAKNPALGNALKALAIHTGQGTGAALSHQAWNLILGNPIDAGEFFKDVASQGALGGLTDLASAKGWVKKYEDYKNAKLNTNTPQQKPQNYPTATPTATPATPPELTQVETPGGGPPAIPTKFAADSAGVFTQRAPEKTTRAILDKKAEIASKNKPFDVKEAHAQKSYGLPYSKLSAKQKTIIDALVSNSQQTQPPQTSVIPSMPVGIATIPSPVEDAGSTRFATSPTGDTADINNPVSTALARTSGSALTKTKPDVTPRFVSTPEGQTLDVNKPTPDPKIAIEAIRQALPPAENEPKALPEAKNTDKLIKDLKVPDDVRLNKGLFSSIKDLDADQLLQTREHARDAYIRATTPAERDIATENLNSVNHALFLKAHIDKSLGSPLQFLNDIKRGPAEAPPGVFKETPKPVEQKPKIIENVPKAPAVKPEAKPVIKSEGGIVKQEDGQPLAKMTQAEVDAPVPDKPEPEKPVVTKPTLSDKDIAKGNAKIQAESKAATPALDAKKKAMKTKVEALVPEKAPEPEPKVEPAKQAATKPQTKPIPKPTVSADAEKGSFIKNKEEYTWKKSADGKRIQIWEPEATSPTNVPFNKTVKQTLADAGYEDADIPETKEEPKVETNAKAEPAKKEVKEQPATTKAPQAAAAKGTSGSVDKSITSHPLYKAFVRDLISEKDNDQLKNQGKLKPGEGKATVAKQSEVIDHMRKIFNNERKLAIFKKSFKADPEQLSELATKIATQSGETPKSLNEKQ